MAKKIITLTDAQVKENPFMTAAGRCAFLNLVTQLGGGSGVDMAKVHVAPNFLDAWMEYVKSHGMDETDVFVTGRGGYVHIDGTLGDNQVALEDGAVHAA